MDVLDVLRTLAIASLVGCNTSTDHASTDHAGTDAGSSDVIADTPPAADHAADSSSPDVPNVPLTWNRCNINRWSGENPPAPSEVECATVAVPLSYDDPTGPTYELMVARHKARNQPASKVLFYFAGGPGGSAVETSGVIPGRLSALRDDFDMVYVDQRGSGQSGYLECPGEYPSSAEEWTACAKVHAGKDLSGNLTPVAVQDVDTVRQRLGYDKVHLFGVSYGTRTALEYVRQYESQVAAVLLDGVVPPDLDLLGRHAAVFDPAVDQLVAECEADPDCRAVAPNLKQDLVDRQLALRDTPRPILYDDQLTQEDEELYVYMLFNMLHFPAVRYQVPRALHLAQSGNHALWDQLMTSLVWGTIVDASCGMCGRGPTAGLGRPMLKVPVPTFGPSYIAPGLHMTMICSEMYPNSAGVAAVKATLAEQSWKYRDPVERAEVCESTWPSTPLAASFRQPVTSSVKTLLLSGKLDMNTPVTWGEMAAQHLSRGTHLLVPFTAHATVMNNCVKKIANDFFLAGGEMTKVDTSCLDQITHPSW